MPLIQTILLAAWLALAGTAEPAEMKVWQYTPAAVRCDSSVGVALLANPSPRAIRIRQVEIAFVGADYHTGETAAWLVRQNVQEQVYSFGAEILTPVSGQPVRGAINFAPDYVTVAAGESLLFLWQCIPFSEIRTFVPVVNIYWVPSP